MGLCSSQPVAHESSSAEVQGTAANGANAASWQIHVKVPTVSGTAEPQPSLGTDSSGGDATTTTTPILAFTDHDSAHSDAPTTSQVGAKDSVPSRFFKRPAQAQQPRPPGSQPDCAMPLTTRSGGGAAGSPGQPGAIHGPGPPLTPAEAAAAAAAAAAAGAVSAAGGGSPAAAAAAAAAASGQAAAAAAAAASRPPPPPPQPPPPPVVARSEAVAQTDPSLLAPLVREQGPTVPVRWRKGEGIGAGSFGQVYLALNCDTGELLAVKEVPAGLTELAAGGGGGGGAGGGGGRGGAAEAVAQLEREVALLSQLKHPNIVRYAGTQRSAAGYGVAGGGGGGGGGAPLYIFLEYVPGGSLSSQLSRFGPLPEPLVALYTRQLLLGLAYLHAQRTVHRDVKGANLLLEKTGVLKLADFGMAKQLMEQVSFTRSFKGSAYWMAPEVIKQQGYGVQADIWSVGCTVLEMATGKPPWSQCTSQVQAIFKIASSPDLPAIPDHLSPQASEFILLCLQREPSARPTAEELLRHPFVMSPLARNPLPPALLDPLGFLYDFRGNSAAVGGGAGAGGLGRSSVGQGSGGAVGMSSVGSSMAFVMTPGASPLRVGGVHIAAGASGKALGGGGGGGAAVVTPQPGVGWSPGLVLGPAAAAAVAAAAAAGAAAAGGAAGAAGGGGAAAGNAFALALQSQLAGGAGIGGGGGGGDLLAGGALDEDHLAALVLGNSVQISKAARAAQAVAAEEDHEDDDTHIDFTTQPQQFRVRGLLTLPPLKVLQAQQLPPLMVQTQTISTESFAVGSISVAAAAAAAGGGPGGGGGGAAADPSGGGAAHGALR